MWILLVDSVKKDDKEYSLKRIHEDDKSYFYNDNRMLEVESKHHVTRSKGEAKSFLKNLTDYIV